jgi:hypothetical protein
VSGESSFFVQNVLTLLSLPKFALIVLENFLSRLSVFVVANVRGLFINLVLQNVRLSPLGRILVVMVVVIFLFV